MPSITTWARLEPQPTANDVDRGVAARVYDPLWLLARQWQVGEFQAEDGGTPVVARWRGSVASLRRHHLGPIQENTQETALLFDDSGMPLETFVARQAIDLDSLRLAVEAGRHFLLLLAQQTTSRDYAVDFIASYPLTPPPDGLDATVQAYWQFAAGRALDARRLRAALTHDSLPALTTGSIDAGDQAEVRAACAAWTTWLGDLFSQPAPGAQAWEPERMEYAFSVAGRLGTDPFDEFTLTAAQFVDGNLDWHSVDLNGGVNLGTNDADAGEVLTRTVIPAPVTMRGMPAPRFWELEDALLDLGSLQPGAADVAQLLLIESISGYGNDWFVIPVELPAGSVVAARSLVVTDTFGAKTLLSPNTGQQWSMYQPAMPTGDEDISSVSVSNRFFLPGTLVRPLDGPILEEVMLARDEMANLAWAVERRLENPLGVGIDTSSARTPEPPAPVTSEPRDVPSYRLASEVPDHWIPLVPIRVENSAEVRLARSAVLDLDGRPTVVRSQARVLGDDPIAPLSIPEEEVPREGALIRRAFRAARSPDGRLFVWSAHRKSVGRGEGSSGLRFDSLE